jgi:enediyne biosynthesis protein E4
MRRLNAVDFAALLVFIGCLIQLSCQTNSQPQTSTAAEPSKPAQANPTEELKVRFTDITKQAGITFVHTNGAFGKKYLPESIGSGCAFLDYNNDGKQDILLINSMEWPEHHQHTSYSALYKNNGDGTFSDVTRTAGLAVEMYALGCAIGDYDNDGDSDLFISTLYTDKLFRNNGNGTFTDVSREAGFQDSDFGTSSTWFDYDRDGDLDLYICNYVQWSPAKDLFCTLDGTHKSYCTPESYRGASPKLYQNQGNGKFQEVSQKAGLFDPNSKALGVIAFDYDQDGWPDLFVANDTQPNKLYHNNGNGIFTEKGVMAGVAFSEAGVARAGMGVDAADYDDSGNYSLIIGNFSNEMIGLYHNEGTGLFIDEAPTSTIGQASLLTLTFGAFFFDFDLDGRQDVFAANGHVHDDIDKVQQQVKYAEPPHLFRNLGNKHFAEVTRSVGNDLPRPIVARGAAYGDIDNDGDPDLLISTNGGPAYLFRNDGNSENRYVKLKLIGSKSNRDTIGAKVTLHLKNGRRMSEFVKSGSSYCSQSELPLTFGLGKNQEIAGVEILWPSGRRTKVGVLKINEMNIVREE